MMIMMMKWGEGSKSAKFGIVFNITLFELPSFQNEATYRCKSFGVGAPMMELCCLQIWYRSVHPTLRSSVWNNPLGNKLLNRQ